MKFSNSSLVGYTRLSPNHSGPRNSELKYITPHCVVGHCSVEGVAELFANPARQASSNYAIDDTGKIALIVEECNRSWCSSSAENDHAAITCEIASDATPPYAMSETAYNRFIDLCVDICQRYGKTRLLWLGDKEKTLSYQPDPSELCLSIHRWFANKSCPGDWLVERLGEVAEKVTARLNPSTVSEPAQKTVGSPGDGNTPHDWSEEAFSWAVENGILRGDGSSFRLNDPISREEALVFLYRAIASVK